MCLILFKHYTVCTYVKTLHSTPLICIMCFYILIKNKLKTKIIFIEKNTCLERSPRSV
jgi:hypothetical protein